jgi:hypothetical protein
MMIVVNWPAWRCPYCGLRVNDMEGPGFWGYAIQLRLVLRRLSRQQLGGDSIRSRKVRLENLRTSLDE